MNLRYFVCRFMDEAERCIDKKMYLAALKVALDLPMICATFNKGSKIDLRDYAAWCDEWVASQVVRDASSTDGISLADKITALYAKLNACEFYTTDNPLLNFKRLSLWTYKYKLKDTELAKFSYEIINSDGEEIAIAEVNWKFLIFELLNAADDWLAKYGYEESSAFPYFGITCNIDE